MLRLALNNLVQMRLPLAVTLAFFAACSSENNSPAPDGSKISPDAATAQDLSIMDQALKIQPDTQPHDSAPSPAAPTYGKGGTLGHTMQEMEVMGQKRIFAVHVPPRYTESQAVPLLLHFHGWRPPPAEVSDEIKYVWGPTADKYTFIAVAPEGGPCPELNEETPYACFKDLPDRYFITELIKYLGERYNIDLNRIYLSGHSGGGFFVQSHGLVFSKSYAAVATFSSGCIKEKDTYGNSCAVYKQISEAVKYKIPFFINHNPNDQVVPYKMSTDMLETLKSAGYTTNFQDVTENTGKNGHSIDPLIVPKVWEWISQFTRPLEQN